MESIVITWRELLIVVALILAVYIAEMLLLMRTDGGLLRKLQRKGATPEKSNESGLSMEMQQLASRVEVLEKQLAQMQKDNLPESSPYNRAIQMARQGRDAARISESCGISRGEAELIVSMHGVRE